MKVEGKLLLGDCEVKDNSCSPANIFSRQDQACGRLHMGQLEHQRLVEVRKLNTEQTTVMANGEWWKLLE